MIQQQLPPLAQRAIAPAPTKRLSPWKRWLTAASLLAQTLVFWPSHAYAAQPVTPVPDPTSVWAAQLIEGNRNIVNNNAGAVMLDLPASNVTSAMFETFDAKPIFFGRHSPREGFGTMQVMRLSKNTYTGSVNMQVDNITPDLASSWFTNGNGIAKRYQGMDPFAPYRDIAKPGEWRNITDAEFRTVAGIVAQHYSTDRGYIATMSARGEFTKSDSCILRILGSCLRREYTQKLDVWVKPQWSVMHSLEVARGMSGATRIKVAGCTGGAECEMSSGVAFTSVGQFSDMVAIETNCAGCSHTKTTTGWTGIAYALAFAALAVVAGPLLFGTTGMFSSLYAAMFDYVGSMGLAATYGIEVASYLTLNAMGGSSPNDIKGGFFTAPNVGGTTPTAGTMYTAPVVPAGQSEWDLGQQASNAFMTPPLPAAIGGVSQMYNQVKPSTGISRPNQMDLMRISTPKREVNMWTPANQL